MIGSDSDGQADGLPIAFCWLMALVNGAIVENQAFTMKVTKKNLEFNDPDFSKYVT